MFQPPVALLNLAVVMSCRRQILSADDSNLDALGLRGDAYYHLGEFEPAIRCALGLLCVCCSDLIVMVIDHLAHSHYKKGLRSDPEHVQLKAMYKVPSCDHPALRHLWLVALTS